MPMEMNYAFRAEAFRQVMHLVVDWQDNSPESQDGYIRLDTTVLVAEAAATYLAVLEAHIRDDRSSDVDV